MEETHALGRINCEGRGMSASMQEHDMISKQIFVGAAVAAVLALASPAYAGHLSGVGGLGGNLGGNLGGTLSGVGGASRLGGTGNLDSQGDLNGSVDKKPISKAANKVDGAANKLDGTANKADTNKVDGA